jgi:signal transduction histidine kinase
MRTTLFWRMFVAFAALTIATVALLMGTLAAVLQNERQGSYENEVRQQAREVADYMAHLNAIRFVRENTTMSYIIRSKISDIKENYAADIWIVSYSSGIVRYMDSNWNTSEEITSDAVLEQLAIIAGGREIRVKGLFPDLGDEMVTIGVPWTYAEGHVVGAVLLHISVESLKVHFGDLLVKILPVSSIVLAMGIILSYFLAQGQSKPVKEIMSAVRQFAQGDLASRVSLSFSGELRELGEAINQMAQALSELEESRRSFVANVSHELRSPLTSMRGYVQGMLDGTIPAEEAGKYLGVVMDETQRLTSLVNDLLNLSRIESGKFPMEKGVYDLCEQVRRALISFERQISAKNGDVALELPDEPCYVNADQSRISQVLTNLIDNAVKFMPGEKGLVKIKVARQADKAVVFVTDNGASIAREDMPRVFDRFYKADKAHTSGMGTGLGLAIVKSILEQHGARIVVASGQGETTFRFALDAAEPPGPNSQFVH